MDKVFMFEQHFLTKALAKANITFPITRKDAIAKSGDITVQVDFNKTRLLRDMLSELSIEDFPISAVFVNAYMANKLSKVME